MCDCNIPRDLIVTYKDFEINRENPSTRNTYKNPMMRGLWFRLLEAGDRVLIKDGDSQAPPDSSEYFDLDGGFQLKYDISESPKTYYTLQFR